MKLIPARTLLSVVIACVTSAVIQTLPAQSKAPTHKKSIQPITVQWLGHAAFEVTSSTGTKILIDPFLSGNPATPDSLKQLGRYHPQAILVTHSHADHALDAVTIATTSGAPVIGAVEHIASLKLPAKQSMGGNVGGRFTVGDVIVHLVPAMHSSDPGGRPLGFVLEFADGRMLYHTGDTWIFGDMSLIQEFYHPNIILLGVGGGPYTEGPKEALRAVQKYFKPDHIIPMHYGTFPGLSDETEVKSVFGAEHHTVVLRPGQVRVF